MDSCGVTTEAQVYFLEYPCTVGCADETACSYIGEAGIDDGSCMFPGDECEEGKGLIDEFCECIVGEGSGGDGHGGDGTSGLSERNHVLSIHPNPTSGRLHVSSSLGSGSVRVFAMDGRLVFELPSTNLTEGVSLDMRLASGMYVLEVAGANQRLKERAVIRR